MPITAAAEILKKHEGTTLYRSTRRSCHLIEDLQSAADAIRTTVRLVAKPVRLADVAKRAGRAAPVTPASPACDVWWPKRRATQALQLDNGSQCYALRRSIAHDNLVALRWFDRDQNGS